MAAIKEGSDVLYMVLVANLHWLCWVCHHWKKIKTHNSAAWWDVGNTSIHCRYRCSHAQCILIGLHSYIFSLLLFCKQLTDIWNKDSMSTFKHDYLRLHTMRDGIEALRWQMFSWLCPLKGRLLLHTHEHESCVCMSWKQCEIERGGQRERWGCRCLFLCLCVSILLQS